MHISGVHRWLRPCTARVWNLPKGCVRVTPPFCRYEFRLKASFRAISFARFVTALLPRLISGGSGWLEPQHLIPLLNIRGKLSGQHGDGVRVG